jgi:hypothetical protein
MMNDFTPRARQVLALARGRLARLLSDPVVVGADAHADL